MHEGEATLATPHRHVERTTHADVGPAVGFLLAHKPTTRQHPHHGSGEPTEHRRGQVRQHSGRSFLGWLAADATHVLVLSADLIRQPVREGLGNREVVCFEVRSNVRGQTLE